MAKVPGTIDRVKLGIRLGQQNRQLTALLCAVLDSLGGKVTLNKEQAEKVWGTPQIKTTKTPEEGIILELVP